MAATKDPDLELPAVYDKDDWQSPIATTSCQDLPRRFSKPCVPRSLLLLSVKRVDVFPLMTVHRVVDIPFSI
jgi:hypothetical protein